MKPQPGSQTSAGCFHPFSSRARWSSPSESHWPPEPGQFRYATLHSFDDLAWLQEHELPDQPLFHPSSHKQKNQAGNFPPGSDQPAEADLLTWINDDDDCCRGTSGHGNDHHRHCGNNGARPTSSNNRARHHMTHHNNSFRHSMDLRDTDQGKQGRHNTGLHRSRV